MVPRFLLFIHLCKFATSLVCTNMTYTGSEDTQINIKFSVSASVSVQILTRPENGFLYLQTQINPQTRIQGDVMEVTPPAPLPP